MTKVLTLKNIVLSNWKGRNCSVEFNPDKTLISGANGVGKSSLYKAFCWCLTGITDGVNKSNHELFDLTAPLTVDTPSAKVTIECEIDGTPYKIEREAVAKFIRRRGASEWEKAPSDTYSYRIDNIELSATAFNDWVSENICPTDMLLYSICGERFSNLTLEDKQKARRVLESIVGEITMKDFGGDYTLIEERLARYDIDMIIEATKNEIKPLKKRLDEIPALIADKSQSLEEFESVDFAGLKNAIDSANAEIKALDEELAGIADSNAPIYEERKRILANINAVESALSAGEARHITDQKSALYAVRAERETLDKQNKAIETRNKETIRQREMWQKELEAKNKRLEALLAERESLIEKRDEVKARLFTDTKCSYCGQELPEHLMDEAREKFNAARDRELKVIVARGMSCRSDIDLCSAQIAELTNNLAKPFIPEAIMSDEDLAKREKEIEDAFMPYNQTDMYSELTRQLESLRDLLPEVSEVSTEDIMAKKASFMDELAILNRRYGLKDKADDLAEQIKVLRLEQKGIAQELAHLEGVLAKCSEYIEERAAIVSRRINDKLTDCKVQMWSLLKNGEMTPDCVITNNEGVKYATCSNSERIRMNIALQKMFMAHWDITLPLWVDESSVFSTFNLPTGNAQTVYLYASDTNYLQVK